MPHVPLPDWALIRERYEETDDPIAEICAEAGVDRRDLDKLRKKEGWRRKNPRPFPPSRTRMAGHAPAPDDPPSTAMLTPPPPAAESDASGRLDATEGVSAALEPAVHSAAADRISAASLAARRRLLDRLVVAISMKLEQLERSMTKDLEAPDKGEATATDHERETRSIGALIDNLEKITEMETGIGRNLSGKRDTAAADLADEAERCRRELADRLSRLVESATKEA